MTHARYFLVPPGLRVGGCVTLEGSEFHHLARVVRAREGVIVLLLDGAGSIFEARLVAIGERAASLEIIGTRTVPPPPRVDLALSVTKAGALELAVEKLTEIGVRRIVPFTSTHSVWRAGRGGAAEKIARMERKAAAACKQSGQPYRPEIESVFSFDALVGLVPSYRRAFMADAEATPVQWDVEDPSWRGADPPPRDTLGIVGPEGGFSPPERERLIAAGARPVSLGSFRLRSETAAICLLFRLAADRSVEDPTATGENPH